MYIVMRFISTLLLLLIIILLAAIVPEFPHCLYGSEEVSFGTSGRIKVCGLTYTPNMYLRGGIV